MKRLLFIALAAVLLVGCGGGAKEGAQPTSVAPTAAPVEPTAIPVIPTEVPAEPTAQPKVEGIAPCTDGSQESCEVWQAVFSGLSQNNPDASAKWLDCVAVYVSNNYTADEFAAADTDQLAIESAQACGLP